MGISILEGIKYTSPRPLLHIIVVTATTEIQCGHVDIEFVYVNLFLPSPMSTIMINNVSVGQLGGTTALN